MIMLQFDESRNMVYGSLKHLENGYFACLARHDAIDKVLARAFNLQFITRILQCMYMYSTDI